MKKIMWTVKPILIEHHGAIEVPDNASHADICTLVRESIVEMAHFQISWEKVKED
jgi:hypothetical protein